MFKEKSKMELNLFDKFRTIMAIVIALLVSTIIIFATSKTPGTAIGSLIFGPLEKLRYFSNIIEMMIPLVFTGLSLCITYQARYFSFGADGCFYMGAVVASFIAVRLALPSIIHPLFALVIAGIVGGIIGIIPAILKIKWKAHELVSSLMLNYVFYFLGLYLISYYLRDPKAGQFSSYTFRSTFSFPILIQGTRLHLGFIIAVIAVIICYIYIYKTKWGYEVRVVGDNQKFARYVGINTIKVIILSQFIAGAIAGIGGAVEMSGMYTSFSWDTDPSYVWDGVIIALLAKNNPKNVPLAAFFLSYIRVGADIMSRRSDVSSQIISIIQGVMILLIAAERFLAYLKEKKENKLAKEKYLNSKKEAI